MKENNRKKLEESEGITLIALIVTIIVLLILAAVSLSAVFNSDGIFSRADSAADKHNNAKSKEALEIVLREAQMEKYSNNKYNQNEFLDNLIVTEIEGARIQGDVAIVEGYGFEIDRSIPKIGKDLGKLENLVFPEVNATVELAADKKTAKITITAKEEKNGISKIEIWQNGEKIDTIPCNNEKTEVTKEYTAKRNGDYTIRAYGELWSGKTVTVEGIIASVKFEPDGSEEWKKSHSTVIKIEETAEKITSAKYCWTNSVTEPEDAEFTTSFNSGDTITGGKINDTEITGTYYLWTMLTLETGEKVKLNSKGFNFDNEGPKVTLKSTAVSESSFTLTATASDTHSSIAKYEFYVGDVLKDTQEISAGTASYTVTGVATGDTSCYVVVTDSQENETKTTGTGKTKLYAWDGWSINVTTTYTLTDGGTWVNLRRNAQCICVSLTGAWFCANGSWGHGTSWYNVNAVPNGKLVWTNSLNEYSNCTYQNLYTVDYSSRSGCSWNGVWTYHLLSVKRNQKKVTTKGETWLSEWTSTDPSFLPKDGYGMNSLWWTYKGLV